MPSIYPRFDSKKLYPCFSGYDVSFDGEEYGVFFKYDNYEDLYTFIDDFYDALSEENIESELIISFLENFMYEAFEIKLDELTSEEDRNKHDEKWTEFHNYINKKNSELGLPE
jgi:hypothetical protein